jgi:hypothetical protein
LRLSLDRARLGAAADALPTLSQYLLVSPPPAALGGAEDAGHLGATGRGNGGGLKRRILIAALLDLMLGRASLSLASTVYCKTREDPVFKQLVTGCSDGNRAVSRYDEQFKQWKPQVVKPGKAAGAAEKAHSK